MDVIVEGLNFEFVIEMCEEFMYDKDCFLVNGDCWEWEIVKNLELDVFYC